MAQDARQERTLVYLLALLTVVTGLVDAVSYLGLGHIFTANMTGNIVLLGLASVGTSGLSVSRSLTALAGFLVGALIGGRLAAKLALIASGRWMISAFACEAIFLLAGTMAAIGYRSQGTQVLRTYGIILLTSLAMGVRNATVRKLAVSDLTTTVLTLTVTGLAADSSLAGGTNPKWRRRVLSIICMFTGTAFGALLLRHSLALTLAAATGLTLFAGAACYRAREGLDIGVNNKQPRQST